MSYSDIYTQQQKKKIRVLDDELRGLRSQNRNRINKYVEIATKIKGIEYEIRIIKDMFKKVNRPHKKHD